MYKEIKESFELGIVYNEGVDMIASQMGSLKCQENDKKGVSS